MRAPRRAIAALYGPLHGGANEAAIRMLMEIGSKEKIPAMIKAVKAGDTLLQGFGHRVYKNYDPRAKILKKLAYDVFEVTGRNPLIDVAIELERIALEDDYFIKRKLYPNVDFYSGIIYQAMGFPMTMFPVLFAIARTPGWLAQWAEMVRDPEQKSLGHARFFSARGPPLDADRAAADADDARGRGQRSNLNSSGCREIIRGSGARRNPACPACGTRLRGRGGKLWPGRQPMRRRYCAWITSGTKRIGAPIARR